MLAAAWINRTAREPREAQAEFSIRKLFSCRKVGLTPNVQAGCFNARHPPGGKTGRKDTPSPSRSAPTPAQRERVCWQGGSSSSKEPAQTPAQVPAGDTARARAPLSLVQQQDGLQRPEALLGKMVFTPWDRKL